MHRRPLPAHLTSGPFTVRTSRLPENRLRGSDLNRSVWGVRAAGLDEPDLVARCGLFAARLPRSAFFSHSTAALLWGVPLPLRLERDPLIHVSVAAPSRAPHARGLAGHSLTIGSTDIGLRRGLRVSSAARTWCDLARMLALYDLVAAGDFLLHHRAPLASVSQIGLLLDASPGMRGLRRAREALPLLSDRPESPQESRLRLILIRGGLPEPEINHALVDTETGKEVRPDFRFRKYMLVLEYQGDYHRTKSQWRKDMTRRSRLEAQGWYVMELNADDLRDPDELVARIRAVLARRS